MKKILLLISLVLIISSCSQGYEKITDDSIDNINIGSRSFIHKGHKYIEFVDHDRTGISIIHDPDCDCQMNKN